MSKNKSESKRRAAPQLVELQSDKDAAPPSGYFQSSVFFGSAKKRLQDAVSYMRSDGKKDKTAIETPKTEAKYASSSLSSLLPTGLLTALVGFLPTVTSQIVPPVTGPMQYFSINESQYAILPENSIGWVNGSCGAILEDSGIAGKNITEICTAGWGLVGNGFSTIYAGLNTTANMTDALECLKALGQERCDERSTRIIVIMVSICGGLAALLAGYAIKKYVLDDCLRPAAAPLLPAAVAPLPPPAAPIAAPAPLIAPPFGGGYYQLDEDPPPAVVPKF